LSKWGTIESKKRRKVKGTAIKAARTEGKKQNQHAEAGVEKKEKTKPRTA